MHVQSLDGEWQVSKVGAEEWMPAAVPGSIHVDLMNAGVIPDPFYGDNELGVAWVAETDWVYRRTFEPDQALPAHERIFLECDGLDTLATLRLNGEEIARADNMHRRWEFDVTDRIHPGANTLEVEFASPVAYVRQKVAEDSGLDITPPDSMPGSPYLRKAMYQWGWDWAPKIPTCGIWRPTRLVGCSFARLRDVRVRQLHGRTRVEVRVQAEVERLSDAGLMLHARLISPNGIVLEESDNLGTDSSHGQMDFLIENPALWWPNGYGDQPLYDLEVYLLPASSLEGEGRGGEKICNLQPAKICNHRMRIGLRTLELRQEADEWGKTFTFVVNGVPIFCKGADWIPADQFPSRVTGDRYRDLISSAASANMNMLRVWGGGIYEDDRFYDLCDEYGILVWQDFMFACAHYPVTEEFLENVRREALDNTRRMRRHACLALRCGNNEMEWFWDGKWKQLERNDEMRREYSMIFHSLLPEICKQEDPDIPYWPSSPASGAPFGNPNSENEGDTHYWSAWHAREPFTGYRQHYPRFMSEFGFQSLPSMDAVKDFAEPKDWNMTSYMVEMHQKNRAGNELLLYYLAHTFRFPKDFPMTVYASQVLQAEAVRYGVEHWRRNRNGNRCMGTIYWQLNDCWPVASWSSIDYNHRWKALQYFARRFYAPVLLSVEETSCAAKLHITNDRLELLRGEVRWSLERLDGAKLEEGQIQVDIPAERDVCIAELDFSTRLDADTRRETVLVYELWQGENRLSLAMALFAPSKHLELSEPRISSKTGVDGAISLTAENTARFVMLDAPGRDVRFSDNFFDLPAGRTVTLAVERADGLSAEEIARKLRIVSLRDSY